MGILIVEHIPESNPPAFRVVRCDPPQVSPDVVPITPPEQFGADQLPDTDLRRELRWYLEQFLDYPFPPNTDRADRATTVLQAWGTHVFNALFRGGKGQSWYDHAVENGTEHLHLRVIANDPAVLAWPWEALYDPERSYLAHKCHIERQLNNVAEPPPLPATLPRDRLNILLVTARPFERDVEYRSISRALVEQIEKNKLTACVTVLRPPTFDALREELGRRPGYYHILHFDGHGGYGRFPKVPRSAQRLKDRGEFSEVSCRCAGDRQDSNAQAPARRGLRRPARGLMSFDERLRQRRAETPSFGVPPSGGVFRLVAKRFPLSLDPPRSEILEEDSLTRLKAELRTRKRGGSLLSTELPNLLVKTHKGTGSMTEERSQPSTNRGAVRIVGLIGEAHQDQVPNGPERADFVRALAQALDAKNAPCPSDDQAAAAAMELLADDPRFAGPIQALAHGPETRSMGPVPTESVYLIAGLLLALRTQFEFERDKDGRWSFKLKHKAASDALLKPLVKKLLALLGLND